MPSSDRSRHPRCLLPLACFAFPLLTLAGCGGSDEPITAQRSQYAVDDDANAPDRSSRDAAREAAPGSSQATPADANATTPVDGQPSEGSPPDAISPKSPGRQPADSNSPMPPADSGKSANAPNASVEDLLLQLAKLEQEEPQPGRSQRELIENLRGWLSARMTLANRVLDGQATGKQKLQAARAKKIVLIQMSQLQMPNVDKGLRDLCQTTIQSDEPMLQQFGRITRLELELAKTLAGQNAEPQTIVDALHEALDSPEKNEELFNAVASAAIALQQMNQPDASLKALKAVEEGFKDAKQERVVLLLSRLRELRVILESGLDPLAEAVAKGEPESTEKFFAAVQKLIAENANAGVLEKLTFLAQQFEFTRKYDVAAQIYAAIDAGFKSHPDEDLGKRALQQIAAGRKRSELVGKPFVVEGKNVDGSDFDWKKYEGKIVLVDFWATWCAPCRQEIPNIKRNHDKYKEQGFEVVGVNLDQERGELDQFLTAQPLPWATVVDAQALADQCGVESIPFVVLVGRDGRVLDLHTRGELLGERLAQLLAPETTDGEKPATEKPAAEKPAAEKPAAEKPDAEKPAAEEPDAEKPTTEPAQPASPSTDKPASGDGASLGGSIMLDASTHSVALTTSPSVPDDEPQKAPAGQPQLPEVNPYAPRADLDAKELAVFLEKMLDKPKSIQLRPGFSDAIILAADRLIAHPESTDKARLMATMSKIDILHRRALGGDDKADEQLAKLTESLAQDERPNVAKAVRFLALEQKTLSADNATPAEASELLNELKAYFAQEKPEARHLRLASNTVRLINTIEDADAREKLFAEFGGLFAKSGDKTLARYGKKLATPPESQESDLVGKPIELAGRTLAGEEFQWARYRGKVVLVDFWATWCGPCRREMPHVREIYDKHSAEGFDVVGVSLDQDLEALAEFNEEHKIPWTNLVGDETQELAKRYGVRGIPTMMLVDKQGQVVAVAHQIGALKSKLEELLKKP